MTERLLRLAVSQCFPLRIETQSSDVQIFACVVLMKEMKHEPNYGVNTVIYFYTRCPTISSG